MTWFTQCRFCQFMVLCNEILDRSILYQKCLSEIHNNEVEYNCCLTIAICHHRVPAPPILPTDRHCARYKFLCIVLYR